MDLDVKIKEGHIFPLENNVYYEWEDVPTGVGGIEIPGSARVEIRKAVVHTIGPTCEMVKPGDIVLTWKHTGTHLFLCIQDKYMDGHKHRLCREDEFIAIFTDTEKTTKEVTERHAKRKEEFLKGK